MILQIAEAELVIVELWHESSYCASVLRAPEQARGLLWLMWGVWLPVNFFEMDMEMYRKEKRNGAFDLRLRASQEVVFTLGAGIMGKIVEAFKFLPWKRELTAHAVVLCHTA
jgi:hypothetical protein